MCCTACLPRPRDLPCDVRGRPRRRGPDAPVPVDPLQVVEGKASMIDRQPKQSSEGHRPAAVSLRTTKPGPAADKTALGIRLFWA